MVTAIWTSRSSKGSRRDCSTPVTSTRQLRLLNPARWLECWSTRTSGRHRLQPRYVVPAGSSSPAAGSRCRQSSPRWTPSRPSVHEQDKEEGVMPGLLRGVARTAVVAGTATAVSNRVSRRQAGRWAAQEEQQQPQEQQYAPPPQPPPADMDAKLAQLKDLAELRDQGVLTGAEFEQQKNRILSS